MTRKSLPIAFYLLLVFVSGGVVGALGYRTYNPPTARTLNAPPPSAAERKRQYIEESRVRLDLTDDQVAKLATMLDETEARFHEVRQHENQLINQIGEEHYARVKTILTPEQIPKYEKLHAERDARAKARQQEQNRR